MITDERHLRGLRAQLQPYALILDTGLSVGGGDNRQRRLDREPLISESGLELGDDIDVFGIEWGGPRPTQECLRG